MEIVLPEHSWHVNYLLGLEGCPEPSGTATSPF